MKLLKNIKYKGTPYKIGEKINIDKKDIDEFIEKNIISQEYKDKSNIQEKEPSKSDKSNENQESNSIAYEDVTKADIEQMLKEKDIKYNKSDTKQELYNLLLGSD